MTFQLISVNSRHPNHSIFTEIPMAVNITKFFIYITDTRRCAELLISWNLTTQCFAVTGDDSQSRRQDLLSGMFSPLAVSLPVLFLPAPTAKQPRKSRKRFGAGIFVYSEPRKRIWRLKFRSFSVEQNEQIEENTVADNLPSYPPYNHHSSDVV